MKHCTTCQYLFADQLQTCPRDNSALRSVRDLEPGMIIRGKYNILGWIGAGGMATVYRARHRLLNEMRAVKVVSPKFAGDEDFLKRFRQEAAVARRLRHENAVWVEDLDEIEDGRPFIAMELLEGEDLRSLIKNRGPISVERSLRIGAQVAAALNAAHKLGIVHRDIKPDNIFITRGRDGQDLAKVLDFGIAKAKEGVVQGGGYTATQAGVMIGTPEYMSPEQAEGRLGADLDGRSDLYSLGVVLYEMLTGQLPFKSDTPLGMCMHHLKTMPKPPAELRPDLKIPEAVSAVLMKALEKSRECRFQTADEMMDALLDPPVWVTVYASQAGAAPTKKVAGQQPAQENSNKDRGTGLPAVTGIAAAATPSVRTTPRKSIALRVTIAAGIIALFSVLGYLLVSRNAVRGADARIHADVLQQLGPLLRAGGSISADVNSGTVILAGSVANQADKDAAGRLARSVTAVHDVVNNIVVKPAETPRGTQEQAAADSSAASPGGAQPPPEETAVKKQSKKQSKAASQPGPADKSRLAHVRAEALVKLGTEQMDNKGPYSAAIDYFNKAVQLEPGNKSAQSGLKMATAEQQIECKRDPDSKRCSQ